MPLIFVSRQLPHEGSDYWRSGTNSQPGVGPHSRFRPAAPGKLIVRESDGSLRTLVDGAQPTAVSLYLIDVNAPDVSYDGETIAFAGLPLGSYHDEPRVNLDAWRIYTIRRDGPGLRQVTTSDQQFTLDQLEAHFAPPPGQFPEAAGRFYYEGYDDTDPAFLPDGRIVFSSTRWCALAHYSGVRASNLFVVNGDGTGLHRITSERNGADRPLVDPLTGKIVYSRWWRNHRFPTNDMSTVLDPQASRQPYVLLKDGLTQDRLVHVPAADVMFRNACRASCRRAPTVLTTRTARSRSMRSMSTPTHPSTGTSSARSPSARPRPSGSSWTTSAAAQARSRGSTGRFSSARKRSRRAVGCEFRMRRPTCRSSSSSGARWRPATRFRSRAKARRTSPA